jgi:hypothetical protein
MNAGSPRAAGTERDSFFNTRFTTPGLAPWPEQIG